MMRLFLLRERFPHMGPHSGYDLLGDALEKREDVQVRQTRRNLDREPAKFFGKWTRKAAAMGKEAGSRFYSRHSVMPELSLVGRQWVPGFDVAHMFYVENSLGLLAALPGLKKRPLIGTVHQPEAWWRTEHLHPECLEKLDAVVVLGSSEIPYFETLAPGRVHRVCRGVDADFFSPRENRIPEEPPRCLSVGAWKRDFSLLRRTIEEIHRDLPRVCFDLVIPLKKRDHPDLQALAGHPAVVWHAGVSDEALRDLYRGARLLMLPLEEATSNNAIVEAMACGTPLVVSDVGGVRDYVGPSDGILADPARPEAFVEGVRHLLDSPQAALDFGRQARRHVEEQFAWHRVAARMMDLYAQFV
jgi:glycosyltransferase involved in cell wall biosynthesis